MNETNQNLHPAFIEIAAKKIEAQDIKITSMETKIDAVAANTAAVEKLVDSKVLSADKLGAIVKSLDNYIAELSQPRQYTTRHEHHFPKIAWATAVLFLGICLVITGWYNTGNKLDTYIANDTKWRYIRLDTGNRILQVYLDQVDNLYNSKDMRRYVLETEAARKANADKATVVQKSPPLLTKPRHKGALKRQRE